MTTHQSIRHRTSKHIYVFSIIFVIAILSLSACKSNNEQISSQEDIPAWEKYATEEITLSWYVHFSWFSTTWGDNLVAKTITEETGVSIDFITVAGNEGEKLASMISSNSLPDIITIGFWEPQVEELILGGFVYALNELADEYDFYFWEVAQKQRIAWYTRSDGNIYAYPNSSFTPDDYEENDKIGSNQSFLVRADIYEAIGSPDMTTAEGFKTAIIDAFAYMPYVGDKPLLAIGLSEFNQGGNHSLDEILMNFLAIPFEKDGRIYDRVADPDYIKWLKVLRELYAEGYISNELFVDRRVQMAEKVAEGRYFCMLYQHADIADQQLYLYSNNVNGTYIAIDGPMNSNRDMHTLPGTGINGWTVTMISKSCQDPQRAIALMSYMMSEHGQKILFCGIEGITYDNDENGKPIVREHIRELLSHDRAQYNSLYGADNTYWMLQDNAMQLKWQQPPQAPLAQPREWTYPYTRYIPQYDIVISEPEVADVNWKIREEWGSLLPLLLTAPTEDEFDILYAQYLEKRMEYGYELVLAEWLRLFEEAKQRLG
ncbi:MAG: extracellular solute-binding protein [Oscillospiraceae bacterium]|nr:extracellular solute-binding protein [Oscillospiraceae bacterium]